MRTLKALSFVLYAKKGFLKTCSDTIKTISLCLHKFADPVKGTLLDVIRSPLNYSVFVLRNKKVFVKGSLCGIERGYLSDLLYFLCMKSLEHLDKG